MQRRRLFKLLLLSGLLADLPGRAQSKNARVGVLNFETLGASSDPRGEVSQPLREVLLEYGWDEKQNLTLYFKRPHGEPPDFSASAAELVASKVDVICAISAPATRAAYQATQSIPIVALDLTNDPVAAGYAQSYGRPGRNLTGVFLDAPEFSEKWLELLKEVVPKLTRVGVLWDPSPGDTHLHAVRKAAQNADIALQVAEVRAPLELEAAFKHFGKGTQALIVLPSPMTWSHSRELALLALKHHLVATSMAPFFAETAGAFTYGPDVRSAQERVAMLVAKVLGGAKPADLPIERPSKFNLIVNRKTLRSLGFRIPESIAVGADRIIP